MATNKQTSIRAVPRARVAATVEALAAPSGAARFRAGKALAVTAAKDPARVAPHLDAIAALLDSDSKIIRWNALQLLGLLAGAVPPRRIDALLPRILALADGPCMVTAANALKAAGQIAAARADLRAAVVAAILRVEQGTYESPECRNVALGHALEALAALGPAARQRPEVDAFVRRQCDNPRPSVSRRARRLLAS